MAKCERKAGEDKRRPDGHDGDGPAAPLDSMVLQVEHEGVQDQGNEPRDHDQENDVLQPVKELAREEGEGHHRDGSDDRCQRDTTRGRGVPEARPPGRDRGCSASGYFCGRAPRGGVRTAGHHSHFLITWTSRVALDRRLPPASPGWSTGYRPWPPEQWEHLSRERGC